MARLEGVRRLMLSDKHGLERGCTYAYKQQLWSLKLAVHRNSGPILLCNNNLADCGNILPAVYVNVPTHNNETIINTLRIRNQ